MGYYSNIQGEIEWISKESFELIKENLEEVFETVLWDENKIEIDSHGKHYDANMFSVYDKISFCINENGAGELHEQGDEQFDYSLIFFRHRKWKQRWIEINYPDNPFDIHKPLDLPQ